MLNFEDLPEINSERWMSLEDLPWEVWKDVVGFEGVYKVSNYGRVKSLERFYSNKAVNPNGAQRKRKPHILRCINSNGYSTVRLKKPNGTPSTPRIHRLVAQAFIPNPKNKPQIDHIDTNTINNTTSNLRWCTAKENKHNPITYHKHINMVKQLLRKKVVMLDSFGNFVQSFSSVTEAAHFIGDEPKYLYESLKNNKLRQGFLFVYEENYDPNKHYCMIKYHSRYQSICRTSVIVYLEGKIVNAFLNQREAAEFFGVHQSMINRRCKFYNDPAIAKKKFKTPIKGTDKIFNFIDLSKDEQKKAEAFILRKYSLR